ncbi:MAG: tetratricopeptide repeat protein, partial [Magnetococcales bacterium]|nr:tetratricopeptide repeat protein [Magnetococcales bacterium]
KIVLIGSDINENALEFARQGRYGAWSFRRSEISSDETYFKRKKNSELFHGKEWVLNREIRNLVTFMRVNLIKDTYPDNAGELREMDLILCRNVFIYFDSDTIRRVVGRLAQTLRVGGYLVTGHAELSGQIPDELTGKMYPESVVYQRKPPQEVAQRPGKPPRVVTVTPSLRERAKQMVTPSGVKTLSTASMLALPEPIASMMGVREKLRLAEDFFKRGAYHQAIAKAQEVTDSELSTIPVQLRYEGLFLMARSYANSGEYSKAASCCHRAIQTNAFSGQPHFLLAHLLMAEGKDEEAKKHLQKALYLDSKHAPTYLELADVLQKEGDNKRAKRLRESALEILRALPPQSRIETFEEWTVEELIQHVLELVKRDND